MTPDKKSDSKAPNYEEALRELEDLVQRIEDGSLNLDETIRSFERGMALSLRCHDLLKEAEQRVLEVERKHGIQADDSDSDGNQDGDQDSDSDKDSDPPTPAAQR